MKKFMVLIAVLALVGWSFGMLYMIINGNVDDSILLFVWSVAALTNGFYWGLELG